MGILSLFAARQTAPPKTKKMSFFCLPGERYLQCTGVKEIVYASFLHLLVERSLESVEGGIYRPILYPALPISKSLAVVGLQREHQE